tara:strand:- start:315 stop:776 length:462 start_codon:yes stop_codon:yes gene_type:complete
MELRPNRYDELTAEQRADIDGVVNAIASGREDATTVSYRDYVQECRALAEQAAELVADGDHDNIGEAVAELVDGHQWSVYYYGHAIIMEHTENPNAALDAGYDPCGNALGVVNGPDDSPDIGHWLAVRSRFAVPAFVADVERYAYADVERFLS